jgi:hypothetical protein
MINAYEMTGGTELLDNSPVALAIRWLDATEAEIDGDDNLEGKDSWQQMLDRVETVAKVDPTVLLQIAHMQRATEDTPPEYKELGPGNIMQLALMNHSLDERAKEVEAFGSRQLPTV